MEFEDKLNEAASEGLIPEQYKTLINQFYQSYLQASAAQGKPTENVLPFFHLFLEFVEDQVRDPHQFEPFHKMIREPIDYFAFGIKLIEGIIDDDGSTVAGHDNIKQMKEQVASGENVILLANHQTECDPQVISYLIDPEYDNFGKEMIYVAGDRVLTDPMAVPFSLGRNLLCVYSKRHVDKPPEKRREKMAHNAKTMRVMKELLDQGGKAIYVAPSGGRDRLDAEGEPVISPFDAQAVEMFRLMCSKAKSPCHFYPLALSTHRLLPPPSGIGTDPWEPRYTQGGPAHLAFGKEIDMNEFPGSEETDKQTRRQNLADHTCNLVKTLYQNFPQ